MAYRDQSGGGEQIVKIYYQVLGLWPYKDLRGEEQIVDIYQACEMYNGEMNNNYLKYWGLLPCTN